MSTSAFNAYEIDRIRDEEYAEKVKAEKEALWRDYWRDQAYYAKYGEEGKEWESD